MRPMAVWPQSFQTHRWSPPVERKSLFGHRVRYTAAAETVPTRLRSQIAPGLSHPRDKAPRLPQVWRRMRRPHAAAHCTGSGFLSSFRNRGKQTGFGSACRNGRHFDRVQQSKCVVKAAIGDKQCNIIARPVVVIGMSDGFRQDVDGSFMFVQHFVERGDVVGPRRVDGIVLLEQVNGLFRILTERLVVLCPANERNRWLRGGSRRCTRPPRGSWEGVASPVWFRHRFLCQLVVPAVPTLDVLLRRQAWLVPPPTQDDGSQSVCSMSMDLAVSMYRWAHRGSGTRSP